MKNDFGFHPSLQIWVIGKRLAKDTDTLLSHGVSKDGDQAFLFIRDAKAANLSREQQKQEEQNQQLDGEISVFFTFFKEYFVLISSWYHI